MPLVSLSAGDIIEILRQEPGLLSVKRTLVRKAYEQGRLLDPADVTDAALFQLLREDNNVRVLATQQIESRGYVRPKPTRQEKEKNGIERLRTSASATAGGSTTSAGRNDEEKYWSQHEELGPEDQDKTRMRDSGNEGYSDDGFPTPDRTTQPANRFPAQPDQQPPTDYRRRQSLADTTANPDTYDGSATRRSAAAHQPGRDSGIAERQHGRIGRIRTAPRLDGARSFSLLFAFRSVVSQRLTRWRKRVGTGLRFLSAACRHPVWRV